LKVTYTEEAVADIVQAITYLNERNPTAAAKLDADITRSIERLADRSSRGQSHGSVRVLSCGVGAFRRFGSTTSAILTNC
jgi:plasmid stabilization system protein ParE